MAKRLGFIMLILGASAAFLTALAHLSCIVLGPTCYSVQMAPPIIVASAEAGTWLAPLATIVISLVFITMGLYALSSAKVIPRLPFRNLAMYTIAFICIVRGILPIQLGVRHPDKVTGIVIAVGIAWLLVGVCYMIGHRILKK